MLLASVRQLKANMARVLALLALVCGAAAWGSVGHQTTAAIAEQLLTDKAKSTIAEILPQSETLVYVLSGFVATHSDKQHTCPVSASSSGWISLI
jgi:hypothetical protein